MKYLISTYLKLLILFAFTSCGFVDFNGESSKFISGRILALQGVVNPSGPSELSTQTVTCDQDIYAHLYRISEDGSLENSPVTSQKLTGASYHFDLDKIGIELGDKISYQVEIEGCEERLARPVTSYGDKQDITLSSTIIGLMTEGESTVTLNQATASQVEKLINSFNGSNLYNTYVNLESNTAAKDLFTAVFLEAPQVILDVKPKITFANIPSNLPEGATTQFKVGAFHVDPNYHFAYEWRLGNVVQSKNDTWNFSPHANQSGTYNVTLYLGQKNVHGEIDITKPYHILNNVITIQDTLPATSPNFTTVAVTNNRNVILNINTGANSSNCASFDLIAVTESNTAPSAASFQYNCTEEIAYTLSSIDGAKSIYLWVRDAAGKISSSPTTQSVVLDTTSPIIQFGTIPQILKGGEAFAINYTVTDSTSTTRQLFYSSNGITFTELLSQNWTAPFDNTTTAKFRVVATDLAGNTSTLDSGSFTIDSTPPETPNIALMGNSLTNTRHISFTAPHCNDTAEISISESMSTKSWQNCSTTANALQFELTAGEGQKTLYIHAKDLAQNISEAQTIAINLDTVSPIIEISEVSGKFAGGSSFNLAWNLTELNASSTQNFELEIFNGTSWSNLGTHPVTNGPHSSTSFSKQISLPNFNTSNAKFRISYQDLAGNSDSVESNDFIIASKGPEILAFRLNEGRATSLQNTVSSRLEASDELVNITHFCYKYSTGVGVPTAPLANDTCWVAVNSPSPGLAPAPSISFSNYYYALGILDGQYHVYSWAKNELGLISTLSNAGNGTNEVDSFTVEYKAGEPPVLINITSLNNDSFELTTTPNERNVAAGSPLYIKWKATDDDELPANTIDITYTLDDKKYDPIVSGLSNTANSGCSVDGVNFTGCFVTTAPSNSYFKIKIAITDSSGMTTISTSVPNNMGTFNILAGNTEPGIGGSASSAVFDIDSASTITNLPGSLVVTDSGIFYLRDKTYGILKIDPASGVVSQIVAQTGNMINGPIGTATLRDPGAFMNLDYDGNLLIFDVDRIRKVDFETNSVYTLIGGGTVRAHNTPANNFRFNACRTAKYCPVIVLPNGDIYFTDFPESVGDKSIWKYDPATNMVTETKARGTGILARPAEDDIGSPDYKMTSVSFAFDVTTSEITTSLVQVRPVVCPSCGHNGHLAFLDMKTGNTIPSPLPAAVTVGTSTFKSTPTARDGKLYLLGQEQRYQLSRFNEETNTWTTILGTGVSGSCEDGTDALQCDMFAMDAFITSDSRVFFISNGMIRTIDSDNKVKTLFGQRKNFGDNTIATSARINLAPFFDLFPNGDVAFYDSEESVIRKFTPGGMMTKLVGNGTLTTTPGKLGTETGVNAKWWGGKLQMVIDPLTSNLYFQSLNRLYVLRNSDQIVNQITGTATRYHSADGLPANQVIVTVNEQASLLGINDGKILMAMSERNASSQNHRCHLKTFDSKNNYVQEHVAGNDDVCITLSFPDDGVQTSVANVGGTANNIQFAAGWFNNSWVLPRYNQSRLLKAYTPGGSISTVVTLPRLFESFTFFGDYVYYCATGKVYKYHITNKVETALPWPGESYKCSGFSIKYSADRNSIIFPFSQNGMTGFAEIVEEI